MYLPHSVLRVNCCWLLLFLRCLLLNLQAPDFLQISTGSVDSFVVVGSECVCDLGHGPLLFIGLPGDSKAFSTCMAKEISVKCGYFPFLLFQAESINTFYFSTSDPESTLTHSKEGKEHSNDEQLIHGVACVCQDRLKGHLKLTWSHPPGWDISPLRELTRLRWQCQIGLKSQNNTKAFPRRTPQNLLLICYNVLKKKPCHPTTRAKDSILTVFLSRNDSNGANVRAWSIYIAMMCWLLDPRAKVHRVVDKADVWSSVCVDNGKFLDDLHLRKHRGREGSIMLESKQQLHLV